MQKSDINPVVLRNDLGVAGGIADPSNMVPLPTYSVATLTDLPSVAMVKPGAQIYVRDDGMLHMSTGVNWMPIPGYQTDASGNVTGLAGVEGLLYSERPRNQQAGAPNYAWGGANIVVGDYSASTGTPTVTVETRWGRPCIKIVTGAGVTSTVNLAIKDTLFYGRYIMQFEASQAQVAGMNLEVTPDNYSNYARRTINLLTNPVNNPREQGGPTSFWYGNQVPTGSQTRSDQLVGNGASWGSANPSFPVNVNAMRLNITPQSGQSATVYLYGVSLAPKRKRGRIFITADDGYESFIRNGLPMCIERGLPVTLGIITSRVDDRTGLLYVRQTDLSSVVDAGGQIVAHGPHAGLGVGTLYTAFGTTADRISDMQYTRDWIASNGFATPRFDQCYIWPGGEGQAATGDFDLMDAAINAGFSVARGATPDNGNAYDFYSLGHYGRMMLPIIGHSSSSVISTITGSISFAATHGMDCCLMLHKVIKAGDSPGALDITTTDLATILDEAQTQIGNGLMDACVLGDLAVPSAWW